MLVHKTFKYKLFLTSEQASILFGWEGCNRTIYNTALNQLQLAYSLTRTSLNYYDQAKELPELKAAFPYLKEVPAQTYQQTLIHLHQGMTNFFEGRASYPQRKKRTKNPVGLHFPDPSQFQVQRVSKKKGIIDLPKIGKLKFWFSRFWEGKILNACVIREGRDWFICLTCELELTPAIHLGSPIGIDLGCNVTMALSQPIDGEQLHHLPKSIKILETKIAEQQQKLSLKVKNSKKGKILKQQIAQNHQKMARIRQDWTHKKSTKITNNHGLIFSEDLDIQKMAKSNSGTLDNPGTDVAQKRGLNRSIYRQGWGLFHRQLAYKTTWKGGIFAKVDSYYNSQLCSECGLISEENRIKGSIQFKCVGCGHQAHADLQASETIQKAGLASMAQVAEGTLLLQNNCFVRTSNQIPKKKRTSF